MIEMTLEEYYAGLAMAALISNPEAFKEIREAMGQDGVRTEKAISKFAVFHAKALITALEKEKLHDIT